MLAEKRFITPEEASELLTRTNKMNRGISDFTVNQYARDMRKGAWLFGYDPIVINADGVLENGQHRLKAVVKSKIPVEFYVITNAERGMETYDRGRPRTISDSLAIRTSKAGIEIKHINAKVAIARFILRQGLGVSKPSDDVIYCFVTDYEESLQKIYKITGTKHPITRTANVRTALFCALECGVDYDELCEFCSVVNTGFYNEPWQTSAIVFRNMIMETVIANEALRKWTEALTEMAIKDYLNRTPRKKKYNVNSKNTPYLKAFMEKVRKERDYE